MMRVWFFISEEDPSYFNACIFFPVLLPHTTIKGLDPPFRQSSHKHCQALLGPPTLSFLQAELTPPSAPPSSACCLLTLPWTFQQSCYPARLSPSWITEKASPFPEAGHLSSWNFKQLLLACFPACPGSSGQQPSSEAHQLSLLSMGSSTNWTNASLIASCASLIKLLNTTGLRIDICGTPLVTAGKV